MDKICIKAALDQYGVDNVTAVALFRRACEWGHVEGCSALGGMYSSGNGVVQDYVQAVELFRQGCDGGNRQGCDYANQLEAALQSQSKK